MLNKRGPKQSVFVGDTVETSTGICTVTKYRGALDMEVTFSDGTVVATRSDDFKKACIKNPNYPSVFGVGCIGQGIYNSCDSNRNITTCYNTWSAMLNRCYGKKSRQSSYDNTTVCNEWLNFQNFAAWYDDNVIASWELDKDLLGDGSLYSPENCCFLPKELNAILRKKKKSDHKYARGVTKAKNGSFYAASSLKGIRVHLGTFKSEDEAWLSVKRFVEDKIKLLAKDYKSVMSEAVYNALLNYQLKPFYNDQE